MKESKQKHLRPIVWDQEQIGRLKTMWKQSTKAFEWLERYIRMTEINGKALLRVFWTDKNYAGKKVTEYWLQFYARWSKGLNEDMTTGKKCKLLIQGA